MNYETEKNLHDLATIQSAIVSCLLKPSDGHLLDHIHNLVKVHRLGKIAISTAGETDMDLERLPAGDFAVNSLVMTCAALAYNILRYVSQVGLIGGQTPVRHPAKRRRIKTVIQELMYLAARMITSGHRLCLRFSRHSGFSYNAYERLYQRLAYG